MLFQVIILFLANSVRLENPTPVELIKEPQDTWFLDDHSAKLSCHAKAGKEPLFYEWLHNGVFTQNYTILNESKNEGMEIAVTRYGSYACFISTKFGSVVSGTAHVKKPVLILGGTMNEFVSLEDGSPLFVSFPPIIEIVPSQYTSRWQKKCNDRWRPVGVHQTTLNGSLFLCSVLREHNDDTTYRLIVQRKGFAEATIKTVHVVSIGKAKSKCENNTLSWLEVAEKVDIWEGEDIEVECLAASHKCEYPISIHWYHGGYELTDTSRLFIHKGKVSDTSVYECVISSVNLTYTSKTAVHVRARPKLLNPVVYRTVKPLTEVQLTGELVDNKQLKHATWYSDGLQVNHSDLTVTADNKLVIKKVRAYNAGFYQLVYGYDRFTIRQTFVLQIARSHLECGEKMIAKSGTLEVPKSVIRNDKFYYCQWLIYIPAMQATQITLQHRYSKACTAKVIIKTQKRRPPRYVSVKTNICLFTGFETKSKWILLQIARQGSDTHEGMKIVFQSKIDSSVTSTRETSTTIHKKTAMSSIQTTASTQPLTTTSLVIKPSSPTTLMTTYIQYATQTSTAFSTSMPAASIEPTTTTSPVEMSTTTIRTTPTEPTANTSTDPQSTKQGWVIGITCGGIFTVILLIIILCVCRTRNNPNMQNNKVMKEAGVQKKRKFSEALYAIPEFTRIFGRSPHNQPHQTPQSPPPAYIQPNPPVYETSFVSSTRHPRLPLKINKYSTPKIAEEDDGYLDFNEGKPLESHEYGQVNEYRQLEYKPFENSEYKELNKDWEQNEYNELENNVYRELENNEYRELENSKDHKQLGDDEGETFQALEFNSPQEYEELQKSFQEEYAVLNGGFQQENIYTEYAGTEGGIWTDR